jgi:hypothetical protein
MDGESRVVSRCALELPVVLEVEPELAGKPFPTLYYLVCPLARARISRLEQAGEVRELTQRVAEDEVFGAAFAATQEAYARERAEHVSPESPVAGRLRGGVGGSTVGVKCLHAHYAHGRAGRENPVADVVRDRVEPLNCAVPCVLGSQRNPRWKEPNS